MMTLENDLPDFEPDQLNPMQQVMEIVELAHQCVSQRKAYVCIDLFGGSEKVQATILTNFQVIEYPSINAYLLTPNSFGWEKSDHMVAEMNDQPALQAIINRLNEVLA